MRSGLLIILATACAAPPAARTPPPVPARVPAPTPPPARPAVASSQAPDPVGLAAARRKLHVRDLRGALGAAEALAAGDDVDAAADGAALARRVRARLVVRADRIGVVLPLSGAHAELGERMRIAMALGPPPAGLEVVVRDSGGTEAGAAAAVEALALDSHVVGIVGPLGDRESLAAAYRATELEVPLVTLAGREDLARLSPWVFRLRFGPAEQARATARYAVEALGHSTFAVVYPDDAYGRRSSEAFWEAVESLGAEVRGAASYPVGGGSEAYAVAVRTLLGGLHDGARSDRFEVGEGKFRGYRPIVDFSALFLPEHPAASRHLLRHLTFYDVATRTSPSLDPIRIAAETGREVHAVQILGVAAWNDASFARGGPREVQNSVFADVFHRGSPQPAVRRFVERFRKRRSRPPTSGEAQAYATMRWMQRAWRAGAARGRGSLRRALLDAHDPASVVGPLRVDPDGNARMEPVVLTVAGTDLMRRESLDGGRPRR